MADLIGKSLGAYRILAEIGQGGMATVYKAEDRLSGRNTAVKVLHPYLGQDDSFKARFQREVNVLSRLNHLNIIPILDWGEEGDYTYLVLPYMEIGNLSDRITSDPLSLAEGLSIFTQLASALQYAHDKKIVHRDIKPGNVLLDCNGNAFLSDFGLVHVSDQSMSLTGSTILGTPAYMSPEQIEGKPVTPKSDQYALAVMLYQMSTGVLPFNAETPMALAIKHATETLPRPREVNPNLPDEVEDVLIKALSKDPVQRFDSISAFRDAFQEAINNSIDLITGNVKPGAVSRPPELTQEIITPQRGREGRPGSQRRLHYVLLLLLLPTCFLSYCGISSARAREHNTSSNPAGIAIANTGNLTETVQAVSTENAQISGTETYTGQIETAVAATMESMLHSTASTDLRGTTPTRSGLSQPDLSATPNANSEPEVTASTVPTNTSPSPLETATSTTTALSTPTGPSSSTSAPDSPSSTPSPTQTVTPSQTALFWSPTPSPTSIPPTSTKDPCSNLDIGNFSIDEKDISWDITNSSIIALKIERIFINWPVSNKVLRIIKLDGHEIWHGEDKTPPTGISSGFEGDHTVGSGKKEEITFTFDDDAAATGYSVDIDFSFGCSVKASK